MNLPQLTAKIGKAAKAELGGFSELAILVKAIKVMEDKSNYVLFMTIDLANHEIRFEDPIPFNQEAPFQYHYFGNNPAASMQYYLTRDGDSIHYLLKSVFSDLYLVLQKHGMHTGELGFLLAEMSRQQLVHLRGKIGTGSVNLNKIRGLLGAILDEKNNVVINGKKMKGNGVLRHLLKWENKDTDFPLIVPRVVQDNNEPIILPLHSDYIAVVKKEQQLEVSEAKKKGEGKLCYICHKRGSDVSSELTTDLSRSGINKIFSTTTFNYAKQINKRYYDDSYAICNACFQDLLFGEKRVSQSFSKFVAGERAFILPEGLLDDFDYNHLMELKRGIDLFFDKGLAQQFDEELQTAVEEFVRSHGYVIHFLIYRTDGKSFTVLETIEDVPTMRIVRIAEMLGKQALRLYPYIRSMSLGTIYRMIPVRTSKDKKQLDIKRVLSIYRSLFTNTPIEVNVLFDYAAEALEKGFKEIRKENIRQYTNLGLQSFLPDQEDRFFLQLTMRYVCFLQTCKELGCLDQPLFQNRGVIRMQFAGMTESVREIEKFLDEQGFDAMPRALFYLGVLLRSVARAQYEKNHKTKPILNKVSFQGMNQREVIRLYHEILEKLNQYNKMTIDNEQYMKAFNHYFGAWKETKALTDEQHLFYLMAGYAYYPAKLTERANSDDVSELHVEDQENT